MNCFYSTCWKPIKSATSQLSRKLGRHLGKVNMTFRPRSTDNDEYQAKIHPSHDFALNQRKTQAKVELVRGSLFIDAVAISLKRKVSPCDVEESYEDNSARVGLSFPICMTRILLKVVNGDNFINNIVKIMSLKLFEDFPAHEKSSIAVL